jgi:hypothetical protein
MGAGSRGATHLGGHARAGAARRGGDGCAWLDHPIAAAGPAPPAGAVLRPRPFAGGHAPGRRVRVSRSTTPVPRSEAGHEYPRPAKTAARFIGEISAAFGSHARPASFAAVAML